ncbi:MAG: NADP-dependent malic enzyme [Nitrososphaeraceae archaeon]|jgi:malate dehydrogenase (oxaloacetate-decarboxylating)|nr:NADP-dependent malic enzyme [Nitrososphaeraceae archaeon]MDW0140448.1 NADP-dependent malic enzyme [Nitrososphaeraceae archaeon]
MLKGKIEIQSRISLENLFEEEKGTLGLIYTPGVAYVSKEISNNKELAYDYTSKWNNVAIVCDGTRVLGLGNVGPEAAIPVMEGKAVLFKILGGINAFPLCISTQNKDEIIRFVKEIEPIFGAINIEDIESPKVLEIVEGLQEILSIPIFHDDQHGTAVITLAALINALRIVGKKLDAIKLVIAGAGSAGYGIVKILHEAGCQDIIVTDSKGALSIDRDNNNSSDDMKNQYKLEISQKTNPRKLIGNLAHVIEGADVFIGVSGKGGILNHQMIQSMNHDAIVFALSNPDPEILPSDALQGRTRIVATGRSDFPNQINNAVVFPSILRVLLDIRAKTLSQDMLVTVANAIAGIVNDTHLREDYIIPKVNDPRILPTITKALRDAIQNM